MISNMCMRDRSSFGIRENITFMGHRWYLPDNCVWRRSKIHDEKVELKSSSVVMNDHEILELDSLEFPIMSKHHSLKDRKRVLN